MTPEQESWVAYAKRAAMVRLKQPRERRKFDRKAAELLLIEALILVPLAAVVCRILS